jgi:RNA polymerase sigma factor (sigma-70 family)
MADRKLGTGADFASFGNARLPRDREIRSRPGFPPDLTTLLHAWQRSGNTRALEQLIDAARPVATNVIARVLVGRGIRDPDAIDDALALVFDHLRRLPGATPEQRVSPFAPRRRGGDRGRAFVHRLAQDRALDVARGCWRRARQAVAFSQLSPAATARAEATLADGVAPVNGPSADVAAARVRAAVQRLERRDREVVTLVLAGHSQVAIAAALGVCAGTVSRLRRRALERLRALLAE